MAGIRLDREVPGTRDPAASRMRGLETGEEEDIHRHDSALSFETIII